MLAGLGDRVRRWRVSRELDRSGLAQRSGLGEEHLAGVEAGEATPSLTELATIAEVLEVALSELFTDVKPGPAAVVMRGDEVPTVDAGGMSVQILTPRAMVPGLYAARYRLSASDVEPARHEGHDWVYVLSGRLHIDFDQGAMTLLPGDSVSFSSRVPHRLSALGEEPAEFLAVGATLPPSRDGAAPADADGR